MHRVVKRGSVLVVTGALLYAGMALASTGAVTVKAVKSSSLNRSIVANAAGLTLYHLITEKKGSIACTGACRSLWPPLLVSGAAKPVAGPGIAAAKLGTIKRPDGGVQVTYGGLALYRYRADRKSGQVNGQGVESLWYAVTPAGVVTRAKPSGSTGGTPPPTTTTTPTTTNSGGYTY